MILFRKLYILVILELGIMKSSITLILLGAMVVLSLLLIGNGITGFIVLEPKEVCFSNDDCEEPKVCCPFYEQEGGICHRENICDDILRITKEQKLNDEELQKLISNIPSNTIVDNEEDLQASFITQIMFGSLLLIIAILNVLLYVEHRQEPERKKARS